MWIKLSRLDLDLAKTLISNNNKDFLLYVLLKFINIINKQVMKLNKLTI